MKNTTTKISMGIRVPPSGHFCFSSLQKKNGSSIICPDTGTIIDKLTGHILNISPRHARYQKSNLKGFRDGVDVDCFGGGGGQLSRIKNRCSSFTLRYCYSVVPGNHILSLSLLCIYLFLFLFFCVPKL